MHPYNRRSIQALAPGGNGPPAQPPTNVNPYLTPFLAHSFYGSQNSINPAVSPAPVSPPTFGTDQRDRPALQPARVAPPQGGAYAGSTRLTVPQPAPWVGSYLRAPPYVGNDEMVSRPWQAQDAVLGRGVHQTLPWSASASPTLPFNGTERMARQLQAQVNALNRRANALNRSIHQAVPSVGSSLRTAPYVADDEMVARQLQAQFEAEDLQSSTAVPSSTWTNQTDPLTGSSSGPLASMDEDERLAYQLGADLNGEEPQAMVQEEPQPQYMNGLGDAALQGDISADLATTQGFTQQMARTACAGCQNKHFPAPADVARLFKKWVGGQAPPNSCLKCSQCSAVTCAGCGTQTSTTKDMNQIMVKGITLSWCCDRGRLFLIWTLLCGFDHQQSCGARRNSYFRPSLPRPANVHGGIGYGGDPGFGPGMAYGGGYAGYTIDLRGAPNPGQGQTHSKAEAAAARVDGLTEQVLVMLTALLPTFERESDFDSNPPPETLSMLVDSGILDKAAELFRNDSLEDATKRCALYLCVLDFVRALGSHCTTAEAAVHGERAIKPEGVDLVKLSFATSPISKGKGKEEKTQSIASCLRNLNTQSNMMLKNAKTNEKAFTAPDSQQMLRLCRRICELADFLLANSRPVDHGGAGANNAAGWEHWQKENCLLEIQDDQILAGHHYAQEAARMQSPPAGRMKRLMLDITHLKTGLPAGIFVRHGASRLDVMKVLIVGPAGSPYEGGLFEFDLLCPFDFPNKPPKMSFRTTGGGQAHFNPNLYRDGKVCLSLLGTWQGETWRPGKSTLLQVFLSIQAMIFCDEPWCNEPGRESQTGSVMSKSYNKTIQGLTIRYAMINWLQANHNTIWNDVVSEHFKNNADTILNMANEWARDRSAARAPAGLAPRPQSLPDLSQLAWQLGESLNGFRARQAAKGC